ncbi:hypothetical protein BC952_0886 [Flavobacterium limicola]|uniref:Uncharacterized protein n=1 Tax=Flavobacterium limicola TaxID=180441 RepID=A0A495S6E0_9FLAO|nr:hypothetical protein BC952_0886 [Flavobacterium limicola]
MKKSKSIKNIKKEEMTNLKIKLKLIYSLKNQI